MTARGPRRLADLLTPAGSPLADLVREAANRQRLDQALHDFLDQPLRDHVHVANALDGVLVLAADTPVWGHRVRYLAPAMLERLRHHEPTLGDVRIIVRPPREEPSTSPEPGRAPVSRDTAKFLESVANDCDNPGLARALRRLARRSGPAVTPHD